MLTEAYVVSARTGEVIHVFDKKDIVLGKQYMRACCIGQFYTIVDESENLNWYDDNSHYCITVK